METLSNLKLIPRQAKSIFVLSVVSNREIPYLFTTRTSKRTQKEDEIHTHTQAEEVRIKTILCISKL